MLTAAQAGYLMSHSCARHIKIHGWHMPGQFPARLSHLRVSFPAYDLDGDEEPKLRMPNALIYLLASQQNLAGLTLQFACSAVILSCPIRLPKLNITVHFNVDTCSILDLSWLRRQPCQTLELHLTIQSEGLEENETAVKELAQLAISILTLRFCVYLPPRIQTLWQQVKVSQRCTLHVQDVFSSKAKQPLCSLPTCQDISIHAPNSRKPAGLHVLWSALVCQPGRISMHMGSSQRLWFRNGCAMPAHLRDEAWQLVVHSATEVQDLQGVQHRDGVQYLQTAAAQLAGWTVPCTRTLTAQRVLYLSGQSMMKQDQEEAPRS